MINCCTAGGDLAEDHRSMKNAQLQYRQKGLPTETEREIAEHPGRVRPETNRGGTAKLERERFKLKFHDFPPFLFGRTSCVLFLFSGGTEGNNSSVELPRKLVGLGNKHNHFFPTRRCDKLFRIMKRGNIREQSWDPWESRCPLGRGQRN